MGPGIINWMKGNKASSDLPKSIYDKALAAQEARHKKLLSNTSGDENPYLIHQELGDVMTRSATVVRENKQLAESYDKVCRLSERAAKCGLSDTGSWTNQNVIFTKAVQDMFPVAKCILKGALQRDESRGAHFKPAFCMPSLNATEPTAKRAEAEKWCDAFEANNKKFLKSTICTWNGTEPDVTYEDIDTQLIAPRPRLYGLVGAEVIEQVWKERTAAKAPESVKKQLAGAS